MWRRENRMTKSHQHRENCQEQPGKWHAELGRKGLGNILPVLRGLGTGLLNRGK